ncbi:GGDEF domain-containing protein [Sulfurimonas sp. SAG-AH-194-C20]|nr:diguanylate cyclase [Sulfurimonas sp. SAG-AH-194-C20]MDF1878247.1 GGDEF domain-containing protein [Sulfurimonas sp. SAG-AH-194-C20]
MNIKKFLESGFVFTDKEYKVKLQHILFNAVLTIMSLLLGVLTIIRFYQENFLQASVDFVILLISLASLMYIKRAKGNCLKVAYPLSITYFILILITLFNIPNSMMASGWFIVLILLTFYLVSARLGFLITLMATITLLVLMYTKETTYPMNEFIYIVMPIFVSSILVYTYHKRVEYTEEELRSINTHLLEEITNKELLLEQAHYDHLTKLPNRILFRDRLQQATIKSDRSKKDFAILFIDLDLFKIINDTYGHSAGDIVLCEIASRFKSVLRKEDTIARFGGDEFVCIIEQLESCDVAATLAQKLIEKVRKPIFIPQKISLTCSIGISIYTQDTQNTKELLQFSDTAMYKAKDLGKNQYSFYHEC